MAMTDRRRGLWQRPPVLAGLEVVEQAVFAHDVFRIDDVFIMLARNQCANSSSFLFICNPDAQCDVWGTRNLTRESRYLRFQATPLRVFQIDSAVEEGMTKSPETSLEIL